MTPPNKYKNTIGTLKFDKNFKNDFDLIISEGNSDELDRTTVLTITNSQEKRVSVRFDWCNLSTKDHEFATLIITETDKLFFGTRFYWGIIDLKRKKIDRIENCLSFGKFEKHADVVVVITELLAVSLSLTGEEIDQVPIDPPFESKVFNDSIEFQSLVYGKQILRLLK
jgi:hypothetical protein